RRARRRVQRFAAAVEAAGRARARARRQGLERTARLEYLTGTSRKSSVVPAGRRGYPVRRRSRARESPTLLPATRLMLTSTMETTEHTEKKQFVLCVLSALGVSTRSP